MFVDYGCVKVLNSIMFLCKSLDELSSNMKEDDYIFLKDEFKNDWQLFNKKLTCPYE